MANNSVGSSIIWKISERVLIQVLQLLVMIVLSKLLLPSDFGVIVMSSVFITLALIISQSGFNTALIRKKEVSQTLLSTVYFFNFIVGAFLYIIIYFSAPYLSAFFQLEELEIVLRILGLNIFFYNFSAIQIVLISRALNFRKIFLANVFAVVISSAIAIIMANLGYGIWSLVCQQIAYQIVSTLGLFILMKWKPTFEFSIQTLKDQFSYSWRILVANLIDNAYLNYKNVLIGKFYSSTTLGLYNRGEQMPNLVVSSISGAIQSVMLPAFAKEQSNLERLKSMASRTISLSSYIVFPIMLLLMVIADPLIILLFGENWAGTIPILQILCLYYMLLPIQTTNIQIITSLGRSDILLKLEIIKKIVAIGIISVGIFWGIKGLAVGIVLVGFISMIINCYPVKNVLNYGLLEQFKDLLPSLLLSSISVMVTFVLKKTVSNDLVQIIMSIFVFTLCYLVLSKIFRLKELKFISNLIKNKLK